MSASIARSIGVTVGVVAMVMAGALTGSWWWAAAVLGAASAMGAAFDRQLVFSQALAMLAVGVGLSAEASAWFVPVLVVGSIASVELGAVADRTTIIRPNVPELATVGTAALTAGALSAVVLALGEVHVAVAAGSVAAACGAVVATRVIAR